MISNPKHFFDHAHPNRTSKMASIKPEVVITSHLNDSYTTFQILNKFFDHVHSNMTFQDIQNDFRKTGSSYNFSINSHFYLISNPNHLFDQAHSNRTF